MIAVDTNILVYAHREESEFHRRSKELIESLRDGSGTWAIPWPCVHEFLAIVTHAKIFNPPTSLEVAFAAIDSWQAGGNLHFLSESAGYLEKLRRLARAARLKGARVHDARVAAICWHHGVRELWTADRDFSPFPEIKARNPLVR